jgi:predicted Zn-dependent protease
VTVTSPDSAAPGYAKLSFKAVDPSLLPPAPWIVTDSTIREDMEKGVFDRDRGLCYMNQDLAPEGRGWLRRALSVNHSDEISRGMLVNAYFAQQDYKAVVALYKDTGVTDSADSATLLRIATSLLKLGNQPEAQRLMEHGADVRSDDASMFLALGDFYNQVGNTQKATAAIQHSKQLAVPN